ncbi:DUF2378 family protein [Hyalangium rubrum]|uniref:DUF2378 family protein n=1 Tax=Hyalangium rubrum TaxID=3103134 RepID=A0ABU5GZJ2_9BACT|nr:DUF2378 family protein [Hyalangium sp. s54d21]MDY7225265.1 DUF2378 family protein [Hyalangium sp. s54d21]
MGQDSRAFKNSAVEGLLRGVGVAAGSLEMAEVIQLCGGTRDMPAEVPVDRYVALLEWLARRFFPEKPLPEGLQAVGRRMFHGYRETLLGKIQLTALNVVGPERLMRKAGEFIGRNSNFGERTSEQLGPRHYCVRFRGIPIAPEFYRGLCLSAFDVMAVHGGAIAIIRHGPEDFDLDIRWE